MTSPSPQGNPPTNLLNPLGHHPAGRSSTNGVHQPQQLSLDVERETGYASDTNSASFPRSSKFGFRKHLSKLFKRESKVKVITASPAATATPASINPMLSISAAIPKVKDIPVTMELSGGVTTDARSSVQVATATPGPVNQLQSNPTILGPVRLDIFPKSMARPILITDLPKPRARIEQTSQLIHCYSLFGRTQTSLLSSASDTSDDSQLAVLDGKQQEWVDQTDPIEQDRLRWLIDQLVKEFSEDTIKGPVAVAEIVLVGPVLNRETYHALLSCFISKFEQTTPLDLTLLQGLAQLVECASSDYLVDNDLVRIATVLSEELKVTDNGTSDHPLFLTWALSRVLDVMVAGKVKDLNRDRDHQPMLQLLDSLKDSDSTYLKYQAAYAYQALQYAPDDETPLQVVWRYAQMTATAASTVSSVFKLDPVVLLEGIESLLKIGACVTEAVMTGIETATALREGAGGVIRASEKFDFMEKRSWYLALQGAALFIRQGRLSDFNQVVAQAPCRRDVNFQWGICRQLGEIAVDPLWDVAVRQQAIDFLGELYRNNTDWKPHVDIKQWILTILVRISELSDPATNDRAQSLLEDLKKDGNTEFPGSSVSAVAQEIPKVEYTLHTLRTQRLNDYKQAVYIPPMAKPSLQAGDDTLSPLMENVQDFLTGVGQVMLILGDSGSGKSTFNQLLENELWKSYQTGGRIPLFINLPALERPEKELIAEQLRIHRFTEAQIMELEQHRQFTLICDGYDESQLTSNLHTKNALNQSGQRNTKMIITCRTQYLGPDYRDRFVPKLAGQYHRAANDLFQEAVIAPFSKSQIEDYVERYVPLEPRTWVKKDYMDRLRTIPNLMDLVKNPFLLTLALEALPSVVQGKGDLSRIRVTRVELYDTFVVHWLGVNKRRLQDQKLDGANRIALEILLTDGFERNGVLYQKELATAIFQEQEGRPVVDYSHMRDRQTWKAWYFGLDPERSLLRDSSLLSRAGTQYRFVHRSVLEYFYSCTICEPAEFSPQAHFDPTVTLQPIVDHPLSQRNLVVEPSIVQFLAERVQLFSAFKQHLHAIIELSKADDQASQAAANAITILVRAGVRFNGANLRSIRVPGADLSGGQFDSAQLQDADLTGVNLTRSWIRLADLSNASMEGVRFGELPYLEEDDEVNCCVYSPDGHTLADGLSNGDINIYDTATWARVIKTEFPASPIRLPVISFYLAATTQRYDYGTARREYRSSL
ncbi:hypothetical protein BGX23_009486 [Mortierella sp. AD031]|nr:hypothetical protein BGX23_009486 [Mortierella sp. AD031]